MKCSWCLSYSFEPKCPICKLVEDRIHPSNADHVLARCLEVLQITGPTADMFIRRAKEVADKARSQA